MQITQAYCGASLHIPQALVLGVDDVEESETPLAGLDAAAVADHLAHSVLTTAVLETARVPANAHVKTTQTRLLCFLAVHAACILGRLTLLHG